MTYKPKQLLTKSEIMGVFHQFLQKQKSNHLKFQFLKQNRIDLFNKELEEALDCCAFLAYFAIGAIQEFGRYLLLSINFLIYSTHLLNSNRRTGKRSLKQSLVSMLNPASIRCFPFKESVCLNILGISRKIGYFNNQLSILWFCQWQFFEKVKDRRSIVGLNLITNSKIFRHGKQCRERWNNHLDPCVNKTNWTIEEDLTLIMTEQKIGKKWSQIAKITKGRTENNIKNHINSLLKKERILLQSRVTKTSQKTKETLERYYKMNIYKKEKFLFQRILERLMKQLRGKQLKKNMIIKQQNKMNLQLSKNLGIKNISQILNKYQNQSLTKPDTQTMNINSSSQNIQSGEKSKMLKQKKLKFQIVRDEEKKQTPSQSILSLNNLSINMTNNTINTMNTINTYQPCIWAAPPNNRIQMPFIQGPGLQFGPQQPIKYANVYPQQFNSTFPSTGHMNFLPKNTSTEITTPETQASQTSYSKTHECFTIKDFSEYNQLEEGRDVQLTMVNKKKGVIYFNTRPIHFAQNQPQTIIPLQNMNMINPFFAQTHPPFQQNNYLNNFQQNQFSQPQIVQQNSLKTSMFQLFNNRSNQVNQSKQAVMLTKRKFTSLKGIIESEAQEKKMKVNNTAKNISL